MIDLYQKCIKGDKVIIPEGVTSVKANAFSNALFIRSVELPDSVIEIGDNAFDSCEIETVVLSKNLKRIGNSAFRDCNQLQSITLPTTLLEVGELAFAGCGLLSNIKIPESVIAIGKEAFRGCTFQYPTNLPYNLLYVGQNAFSDLSGISVSEENPNYRLMGNCLLNKSGTILYFGSDSSIMPDGVEIISRAAFYGRSLYRFKGVSNTVRVIDDKAFALSGIRDLDISSNLAIIGSEAFSCCERLSKVSIYNDDVIIGVGAFEACRYLRDIYLYTRSPYRIADQLEKGLHQRQRFLDPLNLKQITIHVPFGTSDTYKGISFFSQFKSVNEE